MNTIKKEMLTEINATLRGKSPKEVVEWALNLNIKPILTTNFRPYESALLHLCTELKNDLDIVWCDTGYNTPETYRHASELISLLNLKIDLYVPKQTTAHRDSLMGIPEIDTPQHDTFTEQVKLEPFKRAMTKHNPGVWFTNLRKGQTALRDNLDIVSQSKDGIIKVSPFYYYSDEDLDAYLSTHKLPNNFKYFDPTKALTNRECGLHT